MVSIPIIVRSTVRASKVLDTSWVSFLFQGWNLSELQVSSSIQSRVFLIKELIYIDWLYLMTEFNDTYFLKGWMTGASYTYLCIKPRKQSFSVRMVHIVVVHHKVKDHLLV